MGTPRLDTPFIEEPDRRFDLLDLALNQSVIV